jgi:hypothetical protein
MTAVTEGRARRYHDAALHSAGRRNLMLFVLALPLLSGKGMHKKWLIEGQFDHLIYKIHLLGWMLIAAGLIWHVASAFQRGGAPLVASMADLQVKEHDKPTDWPKQMVNWLGHHR